MRCNWCNEIMTPRLSYDGDREIGLTIPVVRCTLTIEHIPRQLVLHPCCADELAEIIASKAQADGK